MVTSQTAQRVLVVEDDRRSLELTSAHIAEAGVTAVPASSAEEADAALARFGLDIVLVVSDIKLGGASGLELFRRIRRSRPDLPVILITAYARTNEAVAAMREGALYYFTKPVDFPLLSRLVRETLEKQGLRAELADLNARLRRAESRTVLGSSHTIRVALEQVEAVARLDTTVLLCGETGTGKELFARLIHERSERCLCPMVAINCAALPEPLLESELFGHERGAFTGAVARKPGKFELAAGGTVFLDEVADMSMALQAKALRVIETRSLDPLGATRPLGIDVRLVAATNRDLATEVRDGRFREDLLYRLNVFPIALPPLRDRREDIPSLAAHFLAEFAQAFGKDFDGFEPAALDALQSGDWPGNVRELRHTVERAAILAKGPLVGCDHLPRSISAAPHPAAAVPAGRLADLERQAIMKALSEAGGNRSRAARMLGLTRNQIQYWLRTKGPGRDV